MHGNRASDDKSSKIHNRANDVIVYGEIGAPGTITAEQMRQRVDAIEADGQKSIDVHLNSYGGEVFEGVAMSHILQTAPLPVVVHGDGIAASIASVMAGTGGSVVRAERAQSAQLMIHNSWSEMRFVGDAKTLAEGARSLEKMTGVLESIDTQIVNAYARKTHLPETQLREYMAEETWFDSATAKRLGFVDVVSESAGAVAACAVPAGLFRNFKIAAERRMRRASENKAREQINAGNYNSAKEWDFTTDNANALLGAEGDDWERYAQAHLAENEEQEPDTKARFSYPFAKLVAGELVVFKSALTAIRQRSSAEDDGSIYNAAGRLLELIADEQEANAATLRRVRAKKMRDALSRLRL